MSKAGGRTERDEEGVCGGADHGAWKQIDSKDTLSGRNRPRANLMLEEVKVDYSDQLGITIRVGNNDEQVLPASAQ